MNIPTNQTLLFCILETTTPNLSCAHSIAEALVTQKLAFCVQVQLTPVQSTYIWQGNSESAQEYVLKAKMKLSAWKSACRVVKSLHPYETPECIQLPITKLDEQYEVWANSVSS